MDASGFIRCRKCGNKGPVFTGIKVGKINVWNTRRGEDIAKMEGDANAKPMLRSLINIKTLIAEKDVIHVQVIEAVVDKVLDKVNSNLSPGTINLDAPAKKDDTSEGMEKNGPALVIGLIEAFEDHFEDADIPEIYLDLFKRVKEQARLTMSYMDAVDEAYQAGNPLPFWHEVIADNKGETDG